MDAYIKARDFKMKALQAELVLLENEVNKDAPDPKEVDKRFKILNTKYDALYKAQENVLEEYLANDNEVKYLEEEEISSQHQYIYETARDSVAAILMGNVRQTASTVSVGDSHKINLPQMKLPEFSGNVREWLAFWAGFQVIHKSTTITDSEKFQYLLQCLKPESDAKTLISSFPVCEANYQAAIETLEKHYGRNNMLVKVYVLDLLQLVINNANSKSQVEVMKLVPQLTSQIRNLEQLGVTSDKCEDILYPVVESCLPEEILQTWQRHVNFEEKLKPIMDFLNDEVTNKMDRTLAKMSFTTAASSTSKPKGKAKNFENGDIPAASALMVANAGDKPMKKPKQCGFCDKNHDTASCGKAKTQMTLEERQSRIREKNLCYRCLSPGHTSNRCKAFIRCSICTGKHYEMLCTGQGSHTQQSNVASGTMPYKNMMNVPNQVPSAAFVGTTGNGTTLQSQQSHSASTSNFHTGMSNVAGRSKVALFTLSARLVTATGSLIVRMFIDDGSDESYIVSRLAEQAECPIVGSKMMRHQVFESVVTKPKKRSQVLVTLQNLEGTTSGSYVFNCSGQIAERIPRPPPGEWMELLLQKGVPLQNQAKCSEEVHILIGMDIASQLWTGGFVRVNQHLCAFETLYGWVVGGTVPSKTEVETNTTHVVTTMMLTAMTPEDLWSLEVLGITDEPQSLTKKDLEEAALQYFKQTVKRLPEGRYEVSLPWIEGHKELQNNKPQALAQLYRLTKELKQQNYFSDYSAIFDKWKADGIIEEVLETHSVGSYYMPHKHVVKPSSLTTPLRPVFNASAKAKGSVSLNECLEKGPNLLELIPAILMRFRQHRIAVISDVEKVFLQMAVREEDRNYLRFLWWQDETCKNVTVFRHARVVFGVSPSPFLLAATLAHHIEIDGKHNPALSKKLLQSLYVDNSASSHRKMEDAIQFQKFSQDILHPAKFNLRGWEFSNTGKSDEVSPVLGMDWTKLEDVLHIHLISAVEKLKGPMTRRGLLSMVNSIFDPLGFVCAFTLVPKLLYQQCCEQKLGYDDPLPPDIGANLEKWKGQVSELCNVRIKRWMSVTDNENSISIHTFCDGSKAGFACCVYLRSTNQQDVDVQLIYAKSRVAPIKKKLTIPRLELMACLIGARLTATVLESLDLQHVPVTYWSDSTTALAWILNDKEWGRFVANRVEDIRKLTLPQQWKHVPGDYNPADLPSRGCTARKLVDEKWWEGPAWLRLPEESWPSSKPKYDDGIVMEELKKRIVSCQATVPEYEILNNLVRLSDYHKVLRVVAYVLRYKEKLKQKCIMKTKKKIVLSRKTSKIHECSSEEIMLAEKAIVQLVQHDKYSSLEDRRLQEMAAFMDAEGIIRIKSQLLFGDDHFNIRCPIILPDDCEMVQMLIRKEHETNSHAGLQMLQALIRNRFWIVHSRRVIGNVIRSCVHCRKFLAKKCAAPTVPLPLDRIRNTVCFDVTGVDLAGPLFLRGGDRVWIVLYTDAVYRGVHLELTTTLSAEGFIRTFRRFIARRGRPSIVYSDNGLNFVGCNNLFRSLEWNDVLRYASVNRIAWKFNPPTAAWWGGWWERLVGLMKTLLRRILGKRVVDYDELHTIVIDVEATMNSRPLTFMSDASGELLPLCPSFHMRDNPHAELPEADTADAVSLRRSARKSQELRQELRSRFRKEYLAMLKHVGKQKHDILKPGDVVLIGSDDKKRIDWPIGVVKEVYPGRDGVVRTALVKTKDGKYLRAVQRLYILEVSSREELQLEVETPDPEDADTHVQQPVVKTKYGRVVKKPDRYDHK